MPAVTTPVAEPGPGQSQVVIDAVSEPALVEEVTGRMEGTDARGYSVTGLTYRTVCLSTPCAVDLPLGAHQLRLSSLSDSNRWGLGTLVVGPAPGAYRYALGTHNPGKGLLAMISIGAGVALATGGGALFAIGSQTNLITRQPDSPGLQAPGAGLMIGGGALIILGAVLIALFPAETQDGTGVQWTPAGN